MPNLKAGSGRTLQGQQAFKPSDISGLTYWFDATVLDTLYTSDAFTTLTATDGGDVRGWKDLSGNGYNASVNPIGLKCTYSANGLNNMPCVVNGGTGWLRKSTTPIIAQGFTTFVVFKHTAVVASSFIWDGGGGTTNRVRLGLTAASLRTANAGTALTSLNTEDTNAHIHEFVVNGTSSELYIDGALDISGAAGANSIEGLTLFASRADANISNGRMGEVLVYNSVLTTAQRGQVRRYLARKWGFQLP